MNTKLAATLSRSKNELRKLTEEEELQDIPREGKLVVQDMTQGVFLWVDLVCAVQAMPLTGPDRISCFWKFTNLINQEMSHVRLLGQRVFL